MKTVLINLGKLGLAGASILIIASVVLLTGPSPEDGVSSAQADIVDIFPRAARSDHAFSQLMYDEGIPARPFNYNGNVIYFGAKNERNTQPRVELHHLQQKFVERGINEEVHTQSLSEQGLLHSFTEEHVQALSDLADPSKDSSAFFDNMKPEDVQRRGELASKVLNGEIIPILNHDDYISMSGIVPKDKGTKVTHMNVNEVWERNEEGVVDVMHNTQGFRFMDLTREDDGTTSTTATWADKDFDARKIKPDYDGPGAAVDTNVPACVGCSRTFRIEGIDKNNDPFTTNQYSAQSSTEELESFYTEALGRRGWEITQNQDPMKKLFEQVPDLQGLDTKVVMFKRDDQYINVFLSDRGDETSVTTIQEEKSLDQHDHE